MAYPIIIKVIAEIVQASPKVVKETIKILGINIKKMPLKEIIMWVKMWLGR
jgi:hypothetical protein